jgi:hypothetical protein
MTIVQQVFLLTTPSTTVYSNPTTVVKQLPPVITQLVSPRAPRDTTKYIDITLQPSDYSLLIPYPTDDLPDSFDPFNPPTTTDSSIFIPPITADIPITIDAPFTIGGQSRQPKTTIIYTTINPPTTYKLPPSTTVITIFSTLNPTVCNNRPQATNS